MSVRGAEALEEHLRPRLCRITDRCGQTLGTGFAVGGAVLTCAHVVGDLSPRELIAGGRSVAAVTVSEVSDVALLDVDGDAGELALSWARPTGIVAAGFPIENGLTGALFSSAQIDGSGAITYVAHGRTYDLTEVWTMSGVFVSPGFSGGPVVDRDSGAVVGLTVANFSSATNLQGPSGFVLPLQCLRNDPRIGSRLQRAEELAPRFGSRPNRAAAQSWCRDATIAELRRMSEERLFDASRVVPRLRLQEEMGRFLAGGACVWAIVDRSGLGKSTALAALAGQVDDRPVLFLRGMEIDASSKGLNDLVAAKLNAVRVGYADGLPELAALCDVLPAPLVIVDGLNEAQLGLAPMRDVWLPQALRDADGCKLVVSCRPEAWADLRQRVGNGILHGAAGGNDRSPEYQIGEFTDKERQAFVDAWFLGAWDGANQLRNPLLLSLASELRDGLEGRRLTRWRLFEEWIQRDCARAAARDHEDVEIVEGTLERVALGCMRAGVRAVGRTDAITREPGFGALVREHLLVREGSRFGFRYDALYEHLVARSISVSCLELDGSRWRHEGNDIEWPIAVATCERIAAENDTAEVDAMWKLLEGAEEGFGSNLLNCVSALPVSAEREPRVLAMFERVAASGFWSFSLARSDVGETDWRPEFSISVLRTAVRAASGYDFRENDLSIPMRFYRSGGQFEVQGFKAYVEMLLRRDRPRTLAALGEWHVDRTKLGEIWGDTTRESTISSWASCCFVYCQGSFTDEELLWVPSDAHSAAVFHGLALAEPGRLLRLANQLSAVPELPERRFRAALLSLRGMADEVEGAIGGLYLRASMELGLRRLGDVTDDELANQIIAWCADSADLREEAWRHLVELAEAGRGDTISLRTFLAHRPEEVLELASRRPEGFQTRDGSVMLDLARSSMFPTGQVSDEVASLRIRILVDLIEAEGFSKRFGGVIEDLLYAFSPEQAERVGLIELALRAIRSGSTGELIAYYAGDQNASHSLARLAHADLLARTFVKECPDLDLVERILSLRLLRESRVEQDPDGASILVEVITTGIARLGADRVVQELRSTRTFFESVPEKWNSILATSGEAVDQSVFNDAIENLMFVSSDDANAD